MEKLGKHGVRAFGEKTPAHSGYVPQIRQVFPDAKFLWIYRDGRDVAVSMRSVAWMSPHVAVNFLIWLFYHNKQRQAASDKRLPALFIKYEELVRRPAQELSRVLEFLGLRFEAAVATGYGNREGILEWEYPWKRRAFEPIIATRVGVWRSELSRQELEMLERLGGSALRELGYEAATNHSTVWNLLRYPRVFPHLLTLLKRLPFDEVGHQLFGRALCGG